MLKSKKAFTIVELVIVIAVIAVLASVLVPTFTNIIQKAYLSVDTQTVAQINKALSIHLLDSNIACESDLEKVVDSALGEGRYRKLFPKSATQGYHFWYDYEVQRVLLSKYSELGAEQNVTTQKHMATVSEKDMIAATTEAFETDNVRSYLKSGFFFMDKKGSALAEIVEAIYTVQNKSDYLDLYTSAKEISENTNEQTLRENLLNFIDSSVFITEEGSILKADAPSIIPKPKKHVIIAPKIIHIKNVVIEIDDSLTGEPQENITIYLEVDTVISLPDTVEKIDSGALNFDSENVIIETSMTEDRITECFGAASTNATITSSDGEKYTIEGNALKNEDGEKVGKDLIGEAAVLLSYDLTAVSIENKAYFDKDSGTLYVAYDYSGVIDVNADNFVFNGTPTENDHDIEWNLSDTSSGIFVQSSSCGTTLAVSEDLSSKMTPSPITLNAVSVNNSIENSITVLFVYPSEFNTSVKVNGEPATLENDRLTLEISPFMAKMPELTVDVSDVLYINAHPKINCDAEIEITLAENTVFTSNGTHLLITETISESRDETVTVSFAGIKAAFTVAFEVSNESPFYLNPTITRPTTFKVNDYLVYRDLFLLKNGYDLKDYEITCELYIGTLNHTEKSTGDYNAFCNKRESIFTSGNYSLEIKVLNTSFIFEFVAKN